MVPFPQRAAAKALGARWDPDAGKWYVADAVSLQAFSAWLPNGTAGSAVVAASTSAAVATAPAPVTSLTVPSKGIPLSQFLAGVSAAVSAAYRSGVWTVVEVTAVNGRNGHVFLELSERDRAGTLIAKATGTIWASTANRVLPEFQRATGATLAPGIKLLVRAKPNFKAQYGFSLDIDAIDPDYTLGDLEARKREIRQRLQREGVFEAQKRLEPPWDFNAVLVLAPEGAAGLGDFRAESQRLSVHKVCEFVYAHSRFQGEGAAAEMTKALLDTLDRWTEERESSPDVVVIIRGGGAVNDLAWLNDYELARLICDLPVPVLTGIGHERDNTLLDEVAHTRYDTPSKVIAGIEQLIVRRSREVSEAYEAVLGAAELAVHRTRASIERCDADVRAGAGKQVQGAKDSSRRLFDSVKSAAVDTVHEARVSVNDGIAAVRHGAQQAVAAADSRSSASLNFVLERAGAHATQARAAIDVEMGSVSQGARNAIGDARRRSEALIREITGQGPEKTLARGFAIVRGADEVPITRVGQVVPGQAVSVQFRDGSVRGTVDEEGK